MIWWPLLAASQDLPAPVFSLFPSDSLKNQIPAEGSLLVSIVSDETFNSCFDFSGEDPYIDMGIMKADSSFTLSLWVQPCSLLSHNEALAGMPGFFWLRTTTKREVQFTQPGVQDNNTEGVALSKGTWQQIAIRVTELREGAIFVNGQKVFTFPVSSEKWVEESPFWIGKDKWKECFTGRMTHVCYWNQVLSDAQITRHYHLTKKEPPLFSHLFCHLPMVGEEVRSPLALDPEFKNISFVEDSLHGEVAFFDGKNSSLDFGKVTLDNVVTIAMWVKPLELSEAAGALISLGHSAAFRVTNGERLLFTIPQVEDYFTENGLLQINQWQHVALTYHEGKSVTFYYNGQMISRVETPEFQEAEKVLQIGTNLWNNYFHGYMDEVLIWSRELSPEEIFRISRQSPQELDHLLGENSMRFPWLPYFLGLILILLGGIGYFFYRRKTQKDFSVASREETNDFLEQALKVVAEHLADSSFDVNSFASQMGVSKTSLYNRLKDVSGLSPKHFIRNCRLEHAAKLLQETNLSVTEILYETGFESRAYFNKCFREKFMVTPTNYRKQDVEI